MKIQEKEKKRPPETEGSRGRFPEGSRKDTGRFWAICPASPAGRLAKPKPEPAEGFAEGSAEGFSRRFRGRFLRKVPRKVFAEGSAEGSRKVFRGRLKSTILSKKK